MTRSALVLLGVLLTGTVAFGQTPQRDPRAEIFVRRGCTDCHAISALGARAGADVGPDLTDAYADVVTRYGTNLESFLADPTGVMRLMLASHLHLSVRDRDSIVNVLKRLYCERRADLDDPSSSWTPGRVARCPA